MAKITGVEPSSTNMITAGTTITGDIICNGDIRIEGNLLGNLTTKGKLVIGATGEIKGEIACQNSDIEGFVEGKIIVGELLSLKATSRMIGDVVTNRLAIEPGAIFTGTCSMKTNYANDAADKKK
ncbi:MAG: polymer-forming cytoskeletal protein [Bacteroidales bacterium]|nr:polymer-forming cytoskeletal protein [Bacteroidales bacterium]